MSISHGISDQFDTQMGVHLGMGENLWSCSMRNKHDFKSQVQFWFSLVWIDPSMTLCCVRLKSGTHAQRLANWWMGTYGTLCWIHNYQPFSSSTLVPSNCWSPIPSHFQGWLNHQSVFVAQKANEVIFFSWLNMVKPPFLLVNPPFLLISPWENHLPSRLYVEQLATSCLKTVRTWRPPVTGDRVPAMGGDYRKCRYDQPMSTKHGGRSRIISCAGGFVVTCGPSSPTSSGWQSRLTSACFGWFEPTDQFFFV